MADAEKSTVVISQVVDKKTKFLLDTITNSLGTYALKNNLRQPNKGEVLTKLVKMAAKDFDVPGYFKNNA